MCTSLNQCGSYPCRSTWGPQPTTFLEPPTLPSLSTMALQDIVEGQQRATSGLVSLLSQERTASDRGVRDHKQQLTNLTTLSQNFLGFMPEVERKFSALENSIHHGCPSADDSELEDRLKDMGEVIANLGRIAEGFACSTGLRLVPGFGHSLWAWTPATAPPLQQDPTSFSATFPQAPRMFPAAIPNSTRSSVFAHSTGPARSVHWPSDLEAPSSSWAAPWPDSYYPGPYGTGNSTGAFSRISLGGVRGFSSTGTIPGTAYTSCPPLPPSPYMPSSLSDPSSPMACRYEPRSAALPSQVPLGGRRSSAHSVSLVEPSSLDRAVSSPQPTSTPRSESVAGSMHRTQLSPITESRTPSPAVPPLPAFGRTSVNGPSPSTSTIDTLSTPTCVTVNPPPRAGLVTPSRLSDLVVPNDPARQTWPDMLYPSEPSSLASSINASEPSRIELPSIRPVETVRWSSLFPSAPVVIERPTPESGLSGLIRVPSIDESNASPMSSPARSVISYIESPKFSSPSEPMTPLSHLSGESTPGTVLNKLTTDIVDNAKPSESPAPSASLATTVTGTAVASTSNVSSSSAPPRNHLAIQLVSFFFESVQRIFKVPASVDLSYKGFEVSFATDSIPWNYPSIICMLADGGSEDDRTFEFMPAPANAVLHRYIRDLARVRMDLAAMQAGGGKSTDQVIVQLEQRVKAEQEATESWVKRVCAAAGALSITDPAFSPRK